MVRAMTAAAMAVKRMVVVGVFSWVVDIRQREVSNDLVDVLWLWLWETRNENTHGREQGLIYIHIISQY